MEHLIEVSFKGNRREFFRWSFEAPPPARAAIIVETDRGEDLGRVHSTGELAERRKAGTTHGREQGGPLRAAVRLASGDDIARAQAHRVEEEEARRTAVQRARALNLEMKVSDAEWQFDRRRLTFYFTAEERIDFRALVRQLETHFGVRVQMWHIGPRDEAKRLDGVGHCGRQLCSSSWLPELLPVKTSLAKEQRLSTITPTQISGACGRLMCCLRYEHDFYVQARKRFPKHGKIVQTLQGDEKVDATDIFRDLVTLRNPEGELRTIPLAQFKRELAGDAAPEPDEAHSPEREPDDEGDGVERAPSGSPTRAPLAQLRRTQSSGTRDQPARAPSQRGERGERGGRGGRNQRRPAASPQGSLADPATAPTSPVPTTAPPTRALTPTQAPASAPAPASAQAPAPIPGPAAGTSTAPPVPLATASAPSGAPEAAEDRSGDGESEPRRGRRRRGRRGGRRHRGDANNRGNNDDAPGTPPKSPNH